MIILMCIGFVVVFLLGFFIGMHRKRSSYHGIIRMTETEGRLVYSLELMEDPELLANHDEATFKIISSSHVEWHGMTSR